MIDADYWLEWYAWAKTYLKSAGRKALPMQAARKEPIHILMNGPSLNDTIYYVKKEPGKVLMCNHALNSMQAMKTDIRPDYYCFVDPIFADLSIQGSFDLYNTLQSYAYNLEVYSDRDILEKLKITNHMIKTHSIYYNPCPDYRGIKECRILQKNMSSFRWQNVAIAALYVAIQLGYKKIYLHGADFTFFINIKISSENTCVMRDEHFYGNKEVAWNSFNMKTLSNAFYIMYRELYKIRDYANDLGVSIINMSPKSMIDCFERFPRVK